jgi:hypothetical protein
MTTASYADVRKDLTHRAFESEQKPVIEHARMVEAIGIGDDVSTMFI